MCTMKSRFSKSALALAVGLLAVTSAGCGEPVPRYPSDVNVIYRVTSDDLDRVDVTHSNWNGEDYSDNVSLPYTAYVKTPVSRYDVIELTASVIAPGSMTLEIVVEGEVVKTEFVSSDRYVFGRIGYVFE